MNVIKVDEELLRFIDEVGIEEKIKSIDSYERFKKFIEFVEEEDLIDDVKVSLWESKEYDFLEENLSIEVILVEGVFSVNLYSITQVYNKDRFSATLEIEDKLNGKYYLIVDLLAGKDVKSDVIKNITETEAEKIINHFIDKFADRY